MARLNVGRDNSQDRRCDRLTRYSSIGEFRSGSGKILERRRHRRSVGWSIGRFIGGIDIAHGIEHPYRRRELLREAFSKLSYRVARALTATQFLCARWNDAGTDGEGWAAERNEGGRGRRA